MASKCLIFANLIQSKRWFTAAASPFAGRYRSFGSSASAPAKDNTCSGYRGPVLRSTSMVDLSHPLLKQGLKAMFNVDEHELEAIVKVDMPGIGKEGLNLQIRNNGIQIEAESNKELHERRTYSGLVAVPHGFYNTDQIKAYMKAGVLRIVIPKLKPEEMKDSSLIPPPIEFVDQHLPRF